MTIVGALRIKDESRWIARVIGGLLAICDKIVVFDDHSSDGTTDICRNIDSKVNLLISPFTGLDESRDKQFLLEHIRMLGADWCLMIDGDELLAQPEAVGASIDGGIAECFALQVLYLWNRPDQMRTDGVYGRFWRPSLFRVRPGDTFKTTRSGGNFHCGNVPQQFEHSQRCEARLLHFGYMEADDRKRKFQWYNQHDPNNEAEQRYLHVIQGDEGGPAAQLTLRHAGPLTLAAI